MVIFTTGKSSGTKKQETSRNEKIKTDTTEPEAQKTVTLECKKLTEGEEVNKKNGNTEGKKPGKRAVVKEEMEKDNHLEGEPQRKRIKRNSGIPMPDDSMPQGNSGKRRGKEVARKDTAEPSEDVDPVKKVKEETYKPLKKKKKEVRIIFEAYKV